MKSEILLNLDSEDEGELFIGCAGGIDTLAYFDYKNENVPTNHIAYKISVSGLKGGHSGDDIEKGLGNSNKIINRFLWNAANDFGLRISEIDAGNLRNAIAREAFAEIIIPEGKETKFEEYFKLFSKNIKNELAITEPKLSLSIETVELPAKVIDLDTQNRLLNAIYACPHGVIEWSRQLKGMVETSTNLASIKFKDGKIAVTTSQRSSVDTAKKDIASMVESVFKLAGAKVVHTDGYPGWAPNNDSEILNISVASYQRLFNVKPVVRAIHAGLECGLFLEKYPNLDMISFGPTLRGVHSPDERLEISTVKKFWDLLIDILKNID
jgi:dipeptidase D